MLRSVFAALSLLAVMVQPFSSFAAGKDDPGYRYGECLGNALDVRRAETPYPKLEKAIESAILDCRHMELQYLGIAAELLDEKVLERQIALHRDQTKLKLFDIQLRFIGKKAMSFAWLRLIEKTCQNVNTARLQQYSDESRTALLKADPSLRNEAEFKNLIATVTKEDIAPKLERMGSKAWCSDSRQLFIQAGSKELFLK